MRKISRAANNAIISKKRYKNSNTKVEVENEEAKMYLFDNLIAYTENGEIFVLDMGEPIKIKDVADYLIRAYGYIPGKDIEIKITSNCLF